MAHSSSPPSGKAGTNDSSDARFRVMAMATSRTKTWRISTECAEHLGHRPVGRDDHVHQEVPGVGRRRNVLDEQIVQAIVGVPICQREVQCALHLTAELPCFSFSLPT
jgi:hypothetical protein